MKVDKKKAGGSTIEQKEELSTLPSGLFCFFIVSALKNDVKMKVGGKVTEWSTEEQRHELLKYVTFKPTPSRSSDSSNTNPFFLDFDLFYLDYSHPQVYCKRPSSKLFYFT
jgi:hypothetical protein